MPDTGEADLLVAQLEAAGIPAFIPDQFLMQNIGFNLNTYGYVRIGYHPKTTRRPKEVLSGPGTECLAVTKFQVRPPCIH